MVITPISSFSSSTSAQFLDPLRAPATSDIFDNGVGALSCEVRRALSHVFDMHGLMGSDDDGLTAFRMRTAHPVFSQSREGQRHIVIRSRPEGLAVHKFIMPKFAPQTRVAFSSIF